jgi:hypothetical protein
MVLNQYDDSFSISGVPGTAHTKKRNDHLGVIQAENEQLFNELNQMVINPRLEFEDKLGLINERAEEYYADVPEQITVAPDLYNIDVLLGDKSAKELAFAKKA